MNDNEKQNGGAREIRVVFEPVRIVVEFDAASAQRQFAAEVARVAGEIRAAAERIVQDALAGLDRRASTRGIV
jgi:hypothetical protein